MLKNLYNQKNCCIFATELINSINLTNFIKAMAYRNQNRRNYDNKYDSYGYCYVGSDDVIKELSADRKGFILQDIYYHPY